jgi:hypothetical protein
MGGSVGIRSFAAFSAVAMDGSATAKESIVQSQLVKTCDVRFLM